MKTQRMYAGLDSRSYSNFFDSRYLVESCGHTKENVHRVELREAEDNEETPYWGWEDAEDEGRWCMIWPSKTQLEMCFTYGLDAAVEHGNGRPVRLIVTRVEE